MKHIHSLLKYLILLLPFMSATISASAFAPDTYTETSVLNSGRWIKVSVNSSGIHFISNSALRSWGFSSPDRVRIHGYGGQRISDRLSADNYTDDLPQIPAYRTATGIYFYAQGPVSWSNVSRHYLQSHNPYSRLGYYFLTDTGDSEPLEVTFEGSADLQATPQTSFTERIYHEQELSSIGQTGNCFVGEDFRSTRSRDFNFDLTDKAADEVWMRVAFAAASSSETYFATTANGRTLAGRTRISAKGDNDGNRATLDQIFNVDNNRLTVNITYTPAGVVSAANLDFITINYTRNIALYQGKLDFEASSTSVLLSGANSWTHVWDVTVPGAVKGMNTTATDNGVRWTNPYTGTRRYVAWNETLSLPAPQYIGTVANQNLHATGIDDNPDMVIITVRDWAGEAQRIANLHRNSSKPLNVAVVVQDDIFNEFSSGVRDFGAFRRFLKMVYDRGLAAGHPLRYALLMGRGSYDNRGIESRTTNSREPLMPSWQTDESFAYNTSYTSDDLLAMLADNSGVNLSNDKLDIAVGRIPARTLNQAKTYVDKLYAYVSDQSRSDWKNQMMLVADNGNTGQFLRDSENFQKALMLYPDGQQLSYTKVYIDAFPLENGVCVAGRERLHRMLNEGTVWLNYVGHGSTNYLASENVLTTLDIDNLYNRRWPFLMTATCSFLRWDYDVPSGTESMAFNPSGGIIASIGPSRKTQISDNSIIAEAIGHHAFRRDDEGRYPTIGEISMNTKNALAGKGAGMARLRFVLLGDPAMRLILPVNRIQLETVNGEEVTPDTQCTIMARQTVTITGSVTDPSGNRLSDFNGPVSVTLFDAEYSTTSLGADADGTSGEEITFEEQGNKLYTGRAMVQNGEFSLTFAMPSEIADNFRPAAINMYAYTSDGNSDAIGMCRDIYVYGYDENAAPDDKAPVIDFAYLNHESFTQGSIVNEQPMFIAQVSDDTGINMSTAGIGHQMTLKLDDKRTFSDVSLYYTPAIDGSPSGTVAYPMSELTEGNHSLAFRVWDTSGNSTTHILNFFVQHGAKPTIFDIFTDANPATDKANFYVSHNRPDATITVNLDIYDMAGHRVWTSSTTDRSDMFLSAPITWNLCDMAGRPVTRGIYIYRATVVADGHELDTKARRIAVAPR